MDKNNLNGLEEMANFTFTSKYARYDEKKQRRETWDETVSRVEKMHLKRFNFLSESDKKDIIQAFDFVRNKNVSPSMRSMQFGGKAVESHNGRIYNCGVRHIDSIRSFAESFYILLCGTGVGFGLTDNFLNRLPDLVNAADKTGTVLTYIVQDTIEGWADSTEALMNCYFKNNPYSGRKIVFDYSRIRPKGAKLKTGGGKAPGHLGLKNSHKKIKILLDHIIEDKHQKRLKTINAYDILMHCADAVLSGGVRRSACCVIFDANDEDMMSAKIGNWFKDNPQRARSNNSAIIIRGKTTFKEFKNLIEKTKQFGEPGFIYVVDEKQLLNPCQPAWAKILTKEGVKEIGEINIGDDIWSLEGWTKVLNKWSTGIKKVYRYNLDNGCVFNGTKNHKVVQNGVKIEVDDAEFIDCFIEGQRENRRTNKAFPQKIISRQYVSTEEVFDLTVDNPSHTYWTQGCNVSNCFEISFIPITSDGRCGFQFCNLTSINGTKVTSLKEFKDAAWAASLIGTLQADYTSFPYLGHTAEELSKEEALLGVSITGIMDSPEILLNPEYQKEAAKVAVDTNKIWAKKLGINPSARITCIKPEGTNSIILLAASGIHAHHARRYFRRIQVNKDCNVYKYFKSINNHACESSGWSENKTDDIITFPIQIPEKSKIKSDFSAIEHLKIIKLTQENWVNSGTTEHNKKPLNHCVSCTVIVKPDEWDEVEEYLFKNQEAFTAVSLLPFSGDKDYKQAPMEAVVTPEDEIKFNDLVKNWVHVDYKKLEENDDETSFTSDASCAGGKCELTKI